jgi:alginate O-acetyltransferase complex protein AlgI
VIWGGYQGAALAIERMVWGREEKKGLVRIPLTVLTFAVVCIGWVFFRAKTFAAAGFVIGQMFSGTAGESLLSTTQVVLILATLVVALAEEYEGALTRLTVSPLWIRTAATVAALLAIELFTASVQSIPFVYFQF